MQNKIGIGLITCNGVEKLKQSAFTVPNLGHFVIINDGEPYDKDFYPSNAHIIQHDKNYGVARAKNNALKYLLGQGCEHIFLMEDDVLIKDPGVFEKYIRSSEVTGILHLNYGLQGPFNKKYPGQEFRHRIIHRLKHYINNVTYKLAGKVLLSEDQKILSIATRELFDENAPPDPRIIIKYTNLVSLAFYKNIVGAFSYFRRDVIEKVGFFDENYFNAGEHLDHTYQIIKLGYHPPYGWFADLSDSHKYLDNIQDCMKLSTITKSENWRDNLYRAGSYFKEKEGITFGEIPKKGIYSLKKSIKKIQNSRDKNNLRLIIKFPTRNRPEKFFDTLDKYINLLENKEKYTIIVSCDEDDPSMNNLQVINKLKKYANLQYFFGKNTSKIQAINADISKEDDFDILLLASDDMIPQLNGYDNIIREGILKNFPDLDGVLWFNDGFRGKKLNTLSIMGKNYFDRFNYIYHPSYNSLWCDNEFTDVAKKLKKQVFIDKIIIKHEHPSNIGMLDKFDDLLRKNDLFNEIDRSNFKKRKSKNYYLKAIIN